MTFFQTRHASLSLQAAVVALLAALAVWPGARVATAQYVTQTVSVAGGPTLARAPFADTVGSGFHVTAAIGYNFGEHFTLRFEGMYQQLRNRTMGARAHQMIGVGGAAEIAVLDGSGPYFVGGYGFYQTMKSENVAASPWEGGYNLGGGLRLVLSRIGLFGEARLHRIRGEGRPAMVPISFGIRI